MATWLIVGGFIILAGVISIALTSLRSLNEREDWHNESHRRRIDDICSRLSKITDYFGIEYKEKYGLKK